MNNVAPTKDISEQANKLLASTAKHKITKVSAIVLMMACCWIWYRHYSEFAQSQFFLMYNIVVYLGLVTVAFMTCRSQKRIHEVLTNMMQDKDKTEAPTQGE